MRSILITGGAGFIGSNLAELACQRGWRVTVLDNLSNGYRDNVDTSKVTFVEGDLTDLDTVLRAADGCDSVIHLGALGSVPRSIQDPMASHHANATGTLNVLEAVRRTTGHVVSASSSSVYGLNPAMPKSERQWVRPLSPYAVTKLATEQYTLAYQQSFGIDSLAFRFFNVFGPRQRPRHVYAAVIPLFLDALHSDQELTVFGDGQQSRDFTFVGTVCEVLADAAEGRVSHPEPVNLAFGTNTTILQLIAEIEQVTGRTARVRHEAPRPGDLPHSQADNATLRSLFPTVQPVPLAEGLARTEAWFVETFG